MPARKPPPYIRFLFLFMTFVAIMVATGQGAKAAVPEGHHFDAKFSLEFSASWNTKHPKAPITDMACLYFRQLSAKQVGVPGSSGAAFVPAHEDCMVVEQYKGRTLCGEIALRPSFSTGNPDGALLAGTVLPCRRVRSAIREVRSANNIGAA